MSDALIKGMGKGVATAEAQRDQRKHTGFVGKIVGGVADFRMFNDWYQDPPEMRARADEFIRNFRSHFVGGDYDPELADETKTVRPQDIQWLCDNGFFGLKIPEEYGGANLSQSAYMRVMGAISYATDVCIPASAANTIGVGYPVSKYGTEEQKQRFLPIVAKNPTGFAFTEKEAGSDPAGMKTVAVRTFRNGELIGYHLIGEKIWTTNGPKNEHEYLSPLLSVIAKIVNEPDELEKNKDNPKYVECFGCFVVPTDSLGLQVIAQSFFTGLNGICNGSSRFENVFVPTENLIGEILELNPNDRDYEAKSKWRPREGSGFRIAIEALNTGRITIASSCMANARQCLSMGKWWANNRFQWGQLGKHEAVGSGMLAVGLTDAFAMQAMTLFAGGQSDRGLDCRLEAGIAKIFASERAWTIVDNLMQMSGGRGYETARSKGKRGEPPLPIERYWRAMRPNRIFEGATELLQMWAMREGADEYKQRGEVFFERGHLWQKTKVATGFAKDIVRLSIPCLNGIPKDMAVHPQLADHLHYVAKTANRLARTIILCSAKHQAKLGKKQLLMGRLFWIVAELFAMSASCYYAMNLSKKYNRPWGSKEAADKGNSVFAPASEYIDLADFYCREARLRIDGKGGHFGALKNNHDLMARDIATKLLAGEFDQWIKEDIIPVVDVLGLE